MQGVPRIAAVLLLVLALAVPAAAKVPPAAQVAEALATDPVYVAPGEEDALAPGGADRLRAESAARSGGTVLVAVVPRAAGRTEAGIQRYANRVAGGLEADEYSLVVHAGSRVWIVTTGDDRAAQAAVASAFATHEGDLTEALSASVSALASQTAPLGDGTTGADDEIGEAFDDIADTVSTAVTIGAVVLVLLFTLPFVIVALVVASRIRRARTVSAETLEERLARADDRLLALGERIRAHDLDVQMPGVDAGAVRHYEQAVEAYDEANSQVTLHRDELSVRVMARIENALLRGEHAMTAAERGFATPRPADATGLPG